MLPPAWQPSAQRKEIRRNVSEFIKFQQNWRGAKEAKVSLKMQIVALGLLSAPDQAPEDFRCLL